MYYIERQFKEAVKVKTLLLIAMFLTMALFVSGVNSFTPFSSITASAQDDGDPAPEPEPTPMPEM